MTAIMVPTAGESSGGSNALANNSRGAALVPGGSTVTLVSFVAGARRLRGFRVEGDGDGYAFIEVDSSPLSGLAARCDRVKDAYIVLPNAELYASAISVVALKVMNMSSEASDFQGVVFNE